MANASVTGSSVNGDSGWISGTYTVVDAAAGAAGTGREAVRQEVRIERASPRPAQDGHGTDGLLRSV